MFEYYTAMRLDKRLRELRAKQGWSQEEAAFKCGLSVRYYCLLESDKPGNPSIKTIQKLSETYGVPIEKLLK